METVLEEPYLLINEKKISSMKDLFPFSNRSPGWATLVIISEMSKVRPWLPWWSTKSAPLSVAR